MREPDAAMRVYRMFYPNAIAGDPLDLHDFGTTFLVPELQTALDRYYGPLAGGRRYRRPGVNYNDPGWRHRLCVYPFQYHRELFNFFEQLHLSARDINKICNWWGTMVEVEAWEERYPGHVIEDDVFEGISKATQMSSPIAIFHDPPVPQARPQRRRSLRIKRLFSRPRAIRSWRDLHGTSSSDSNGNGNGGVEQSLASSDEIEGIGMDDEDDSVETSVGVPLNQQLRAGYRNAEFEDWLKEEAESGNLHSNLPGIIVAAAPRPANLHNNSFQARPTNTITYAAPAPAPLAYNSYSQRMNDVSYPGDLHTLPVAISGPSESAVRSSQFRPTSLGRYRTTPYHYRPIRPRPARNSS